MIQHSNIVSYHIILSHIKHLIWFWYIVDVLFWPQKYFFWRFVPSISVALATNLKVNACLPIPMTLWQCLRMAALLSAWTMRRVAAPESNAGTSTGRRISGQGQVLRHPPRHRAQEPSICSLQRQPTRCNNSSSSKSSNNRELRFRHPCMWLQQLLLMDCKPFIVVHLPQLW